MNPEPHGHRLPDREPSSQRKEEALRDALSDWEHLQDELAGVVTERAERLEASHKRIRSLTKQGQIRIEPKMPPDLRRLGPPPRAEGVA